MMFLIWSPIELLDYVLVKLLEPLWDQELLVIELFSFFLGACLLVKWWGILSVNELDFLLEI